MLSALLRKCGVEVARVAYNGVEAEEGAKAETFSLIFMGACGRRRSTPRRAGAARQITLLQMPAA